MRAELNEDGTLQVIAETPVEGFALTQWSLLYDDNKATLLVTKMARTDFNPSLHPEFAVMEAKKS
jgi:hypothetical protein